MGTPIPPRVGDWYRRPDRPQPFQVVAYDREARTVDVEYFDGTVDEWPLAHWLTLDIEPGEAPQDWTGPFDGIESDEAAESAIEATDWQDRIDEVQDEIDRRTIEAETRDIRPRQMPAARSAATRGRAQRSRK